MVGQHKETVNISTHPPTNINSPNHPFKIKQGLTPPRLLKLSALPGTRPRTSGPWTLLRPRRWRRSSGGSAKPAAAAAAARSDRCAVILKLVAL
jgi:hypothetical protein